MINNKWTSLGCAVLILLFAGIGQAQNDSKPAKTDENQATHIDPRRADDLVIEMVTLTHDEEAGEATLTVYLCNFRPAEVYAAINWGDPVGMKEIGNMKPGDVKAFSTTCATDDIPYDQPILAQIYNMDVHRLETTDTAALHGKDAATVAVIFEQSAFQEGNRLFGSAVRHVRQLIDELNEATQKDNVPGEGNSEQPTPIARKLRLAHFNVFDAVKEATPALAKDHPEYDIVIVIGQGALEDAWSQDGEKALKHELLSHNKDDH